MSDGSGEKLLFSLDEGQHSSEKTILGWAAEDVDLTATSEEIEI